MNKPRTRPAPERGAILIMYAFMLVVMLGIAGFALDLGLVYFRKAQLQAAADATALVAARALNGTVAGVADAVKAATSTIDGTQLGTLGKLKWQAAVLRFGASPDAPSNEWIESGSIDAAAARTALYARADLGALGEEARVVEPLFMRILGVTDRFDVAPVAVAGPTGLRITPLAVCALNQQASTTRTANGIQELVTYGFRHGVTYNLLKINPQAGAQKGAYFLVDPFAPAGPGTSGTPGMNTDAGANALVGPFMCAGKIARTNTGGMLRVHSPASFGLAAQINTRLDKYEGSQCLRSGAPPDANVRTYETSAANTHSWHAVPPTRASAMTVEGASLPMSTVADQAPAPGQVVTAADYGILWAYGPPLTTSGVKLAASDWPRLYAAGVKTTSWDARLVPYDKFTKAPALKTFEPALRDRRLMRIPLLSCGDKENLSEKEQAVVLAYGRFFLPAAASAGEVPGEFAGVEAVEAALKTDVEIFR